MPHPSTLSTCYGVMASFYLRRILLVSNHCTDLSRFFNRRVRSVTTYVGRKSFYTVELDDNRHDATALSEKPALAKRADHKYVTAAGPTGPSTAIVLRLQYENLLHIKAFNLRVLLNVT